MEDVSFNAPEKAGQRWVIDAEVCVFLVCCRENMWRLWSVRRILMKYGDFVQDVKKPLGDLLEKVDVSKFIL